MSCLQNHLSSHTGSDDNKVDSNCLHKKRSGGGKNRSFFIVTKLSCQLKSLLLAKMPERQRKISVQ